MEEGIHYFTLNTGARIPSLGIGTWQGDTSVAGSVIVNAIVTAIKAGYRHIDCARFYGNEKEVGLALKKLFEDGVVNREDLFITSKLWCTDHGPEEVPKALDLTLKDLQLDHVDLYLIHWPFRVKNGTSIARENFTCGDAKGKDFSPEDIIPPNIQSTWRAMEELYDFGKAHAIGVSNFSTKKLADLLDFACVPPAVVQVECHPGWQQEKLHSFCKLKGIHLSGYTPLGSPGSLSNLLKDPILTTMAEDLRKTPAQIALRWGLQRGHSVIPKSTSEHRIRENFEIFDWSIPEDLLAKISAIKQGKLMRGEFCISERSGYRTLEELWDGEI